MSRTHGCAWKLALTRAALCVCTWLFQWAGALLQALLPRRRLRCGGGGG
jgi:hypothetical protein